MRFVVSALLLATAAVPAIATAQAPAAASASKYSVEETDLGTLLDDPAAKAVLNKYIAAMIANEQIDMARGMTLKTLQGYSGDALTDDTLAKIDAELKQIK